MVYGAQAVDGEGPGGRGRWVPTMLSGRSGSFPTLRSLDFILKAVAISEGLGGTAFCVLGRGHELLWDDGPGQVSLGPRWPAGGCFGGLGEQVLNEAGQLEGRGDEEVPGRENRPAGVDLLEVDCMYLLCHNCFLSES